METSNALRLKNRRQYIVAPHRIECSPYFIEKRITANCYLYSHIDLKVTVYEKNHISLILLGEIFDFENHKKSNEDILNDLSKGDFKYFSEKLADYAGRYVIIRIAYDQVFFFHDATASRKVYYTSARDGNWCSSRPQLIAELLNINITSDESFQKYFKSYGYEWLAHSNIGNLTNYEEIFQLLPNHYLRYDDLNIKRYWPNKPVQQRPLKEVAAKCAEMIKGYVTAFNERFDLMVPLTGGKDSRIIMAATREFRDRVFYYVNKEKRLNDKSADIVIPSRMAKDLGFDFHVVNPYPENMDQDFEKVYFENNPMATTKYFPLIHNYYSNFSDKVNIPGVFAASAFEMYGKFDKKITPGVLAKLNKVEEFDFAVEYYTRWLEKNLDICRENNLSIFTLFYWEERMANWGTQLQLEKDIAQEDLTPYNSRRLIEYTFSVPPKCNNQPDYLLYKEILRILWPETLNYPINPGFIKSAKKLLHAFKLLNAVKAIRFMFSHRKYLQKARTERITDETVTHQLSPVNLEVAKVG